MMMMIDKIELMRKDYELLLEEALKLDAETNDKKVHNNLDLELIFLIDEIKLLKKYEKIKKQYEEIK